MFLVFLLLCFKTYATQIIYSHPVPFDRVSLEQSSRQEAILFTQDQHALRIALSDGRILANVSNPCHPDPYVLPVWAEGYLVTPQKTCRWNNSTNQFDLIAQHPNLPENTFSIQYLGTLDQKIVWILNSRSQAGQGFLHLRIFDRGTHLSSEFRNAVTGVPGFSGGMARGEDGRVLFVGEGSAAESSRIHRVDIPSLMQLTQSRAPTSFSQLDRSGATESLNSLSLWLQSGPRGLLMGTTNDDGDPRASWVDPSMRLHSYIADQSCLPVFFVGENLYTICDHLRLTRYSGLAEIRTLFE